MLEDAEAPLAINDPWEGMNRSIYRFNSYADRWVLNPAVSAYEFIFPGVVRKSISNFFTNLDNIQTVINQILQLHPMPALQTTGRFLVNTTIGVVGLWDPATPIGIPQHYEDFGQTLGRWGVGTGPYLVLPLFGPSFVRDAGGRLVDAQIFTAIDPLQLDNVNEGYTYLYYTLLVLNTRSTIISKGISAGKGQNSYRGLVKIQKSATNARNFSQCDSMLIGSKCGAHTFPYIDVQNSTAQMEHEATTSKIGEDQLFYFQSRGIGTEDAVNMIVNGFCKEVFKELPMEFAVEAQKLLGVSLEGSVG
jgi:ABC-type transporter lipoprotein component MlaA